MQKNGLLAEIRTQAKLESIVIVATALMGGVAQSLLVIFISKDIYRAYAGTIQIWEIGWYLGLVVVSILSTQFANRRSLKLIESLTTQLRLRIVDKLRRMELRDLEIMGKNEILSRMSIDSEVLSTAARIAVSGLSYLVILLMILLYISWVAPSLAFLIVIMMAVVGVVYSFLNHQTRTTNKNASKVDHCLFALIGHLTSGFRELKLHFPKRQDLLLNHIVPTAQKAQQSHLDHTSWQINHFFTASMLFFFLLSWCLFILSSHMQPSQIPGLVFLVMYLWMPLSELTVTLPYFVRADETFHQLSQFEQQVSHLPLSSLEKQMPPPTFEQIDLHQLSFEFTNEEGNPTFGIGPLNLQIQAGEILFIVGGNGNGKTTLLKLITGLYPPKTGKLLIDGKPVPPLDYRGLFAPVFTDFHLFDRLYGLSSYDQEYMNSLMKMLDLSPHTELKEGTFTNLKLSTGQRKRLALLIACLEARPVLVFDEWAADQDPEFREYFYYKLLPQLKAEGRTIIAVTHDDRYFSCADRLWHMEYGRIILPDLLHK